LTYTVTVMNILVRKLFCWHWKWWGLHYKELVTTPTCQDRFEYWKWVFLSWDLCSSSRYTGTYTDNATYRNNG